VSAWPIVLEQLAHGHDLTVSDATWAMEQVMVGAASDAQIGALAMGLRSKGVTAAELGAFTAVMHAHGERISAPESALDTCGTGGDGLHTVNISTMAAIVVAASGTPVVKHGNRAASSSSGSADVLARLGVVVDLPPADVQRCLDTVGICFAFAPVFHPALRHAAGPRRELAIRTVFNFLGPITNPAGVLRQTVGVADAHMAPVVAEVLAARGSRALVYRGDDGLDELSVTGGTTIWQVADGDVVGERLHPDELALPVSDIAALRGGDPDANADIVRQFLAGAHGAVRDAVLLNAAGALSLADDPSTPLASRLGRALDTAAELVDSGAASALLGRWVTASVALAG
jgi:anthranilate phosphoribosyltransferase